MALFTAKYHGRCRACGDEIEPGDEAGFIRGEDGAHCVGCVEAADDHQEDGRWR